MTDGYKHRIGIGSYLVWSQIVAARLAGRFVFRLLCTGQFQNRPSPPPRAIPGHLTRVELRTAGNLTQNEARPVGHLTFVSKRLSAVRSKMILQFFDSAGEPRPRVIALVDSTWVFLLLSFYIVLS